MNLIASLDRWLFEEYRTDVESLGLYRILYAAYVLLVVLPWGLWIKDLPEASFNPPVSLPALFTSYPPYWMMVALNAVTMAATCMLLIGWHTVASSVIVAIGLTLVDGFSFADGKIDQIFILVLIPLTLAGSGWGRAFALGKQPEDVNSPSPNQPWLLATMALLIGLGLFTAGLGKINGGWLNAGSLGTKWQLLNNYYAVGRTTAGGAVALEYSSPWAWKLMDWSVVVWETGFVLTVFRRRWCLIACALGTLFHLGVWLIFDIAVTENLIAYAALVAWATISPAFTARLRAKVATLSQRAAARLTMSVFALAVLLFAVSPGRLAALHTALRDILVIVAVPFGLIYLLVRFRQWGRGKISRPAVVA